MGGAEPESPRPIGEHRHRGAAVPPQVPRALTARVTMCSNTLICTHCIVYKHTPVRGTVSGVPFHCTVCSTDGTSLAGYTPGEVPARQLHADAAGIRAPVLGQQGDFA